MDLLKGTGKWMEKLIINLGGKSVDKPQIEISRRSSMYMSFGNMEAKYQNKQLKELKEVASGNLR